MLPHAVVAFSVGFHRFVGPKLVDPHRFSGFSTWSRKSDGLLAEGFGATFDFGFLFPPLALRFSGARPCHVSFAHRESSVVVLVPIV